MIFFGGAHTAQHVGSEFPHQGSARDRTRARCSWKRGVLTTGLPGKSPYIMILKAIYIYIYICVCVCVCVYDYKGMYVQCVGNLENLGKYEKH